MAPTRFCACAVLLLLAAAAVQALAGSAAASASPSERTLKKLPDDSASRMPFVLNSQLVGHGGAVLLPAASHTGAFAA